MIGVVCGAKTIPQTHVYPVLTHINEVMTTKSPS